MRALRVAGAPTSKTADCAEHFMTHPFAFAYAVSSLRIASLVSSGTIVTLRG